MSHLDVLNQLQQETARHMGHLSKPFVGVLSQYVFGMVMLRHGGQSQIANFLSQFLDEKVGSVKQRLRELTYESAQKRGKKRRELAVEASFAPLLRWIVSRFKNDPRQLVFALDVTHPSNRLSRLVHKGMNPLHLRGICFRGDPLPCTVSLQWGADYDKPCAIVTSLPPHALEPALYGLRCWIERGFKSFKRGFFHWEHSKMTCPKRAKRLWLVMSIALLWLVAVGEETLDTLAYGSSRRGRPQKRTLSALVQGWSSLIARALRGEPFSFGFLPDYLVSVPDPPNTYP